MIAFFRRMNLPNRLTCLRMVLVPVFCALVSVESAAFQTAAAAVFLLASLTDMLDGRIARSRGLITDFGKLMDPIADKLLVTAAMVFLTAQRRMPAGVCVAFIGREFVISGFRMVAASRGVVIAAGKLGKYKTVLQMAAITLSVLFLPTPSLAPVIDWMPLRVIAHVCIWVALALAVISCIDYIVRNRGAVDTDNI